MKSVDTKSRELEELVREKGELFQRKITPIRGFRKPHVVEVIETLIGDVSESKVTAHPGKHTIVTGVRGEEFVLENDKFDKLYEMKVDGTVVARKRLIRALQNPFGVRIRINAPWGGPQFGNTDSMLAYELDEHGNFTDDRYIINNYDMLLENYDPVE